MKRFEGHEVQRITVAVRNAGDGLSKALGIEPRELHIGDTVYLALEARVTGIVHDEIVIDGEPSGMIERKARLRAGTANLIDAEAVKDLLDATRAKIEAEAGIERLDFGEGETDDLAG